MTVRGGAWPGSDDLLLGKAYVSLAGTRISHTFLLIERYRPLSDSDSKALARRR